MEKDKEPRNSDYSQNRLAELSERYGLIFKKPGRYINSLLKFYSETPTIKNSMVDFINDPRLEKLLKKGNDIIATYGANSNVKKKMEKNIASILVGIVATVDVSDDIGSKYSIEGKSKNLLDMDFKLAEKLMEDPKYASKSIELLNMIASNTFIIPEILKRKGGIVEEPLTLDRLPVELYTSLISNYGLMERKRFHEFVNSCYKASTGSKKGEWHNIALLTREELGKEDIESEKIAMNRMLALHYFIIGKMVRNNDK